jgi:5-methylcytosine-specific restriction endonuclease McrA
MDTVEPPAPNTKFVGREKEYLREYNQRNKERQRIRKKEWRENNRIKKAEADKHWRETNKERVAKNVKAYQQSHKPQVNATNRRWQLRNREQYLKLHRKVQNAYYASHREYYKAKASERRARLAAAAVNLKGILSFVERMKAKPFCLCYYCGRKVTSSKIHFDHIVPLSKGGAHSVENLCVSCSGCNQAKYNKPIQAWVKMGQQIFSL